MVSSRYVERRYQMCRAPSRGLQATAFPFASAPRLKPAVSRTSADTSLMVTGGLFRHRAMVGYGIGIIGAVSGCSPVDRQFGFSRVFPIRTADVAW